MPSNRKKQQSQSQWWPPSPPFKSEAEVIISKFQNAVLLYRKMPLSLLKQALSTTINIRVHRAPHITMNRMEGPLPLIMLIFQISQLFQIEIPTLAILTLIWHAEKQLMKTDFLPLEAAIVSSRELTLFSQRRTQVNINQWLPPMWLLLLPSIPKINRFTKPWHLNLTQSQ